MGSYQYMIFQIAGIHSRTNINKYRHVPGLGGTYCNIPELLLNLKDLKQFMYHNIIDMCVLR